MKKKLNRIRKAKYFLFKNRVHKVLPTSKLMFWGHVGAVSEWIAKHRDLKYSTFPVKKFDYEQRYELYQYVVDNEIKGEPIDYLEFGVASGISFRWWVDKIKHKDSRFYGFDTFTGLPEDWGPFKKGAMSNGNEIPQIDGDRHEFYQGIFQDTLFKFLETYEVGRRKVIHLDADLYSATLFVLTSLSPYLRKGDILMFDEFNVPMHEFKAFTEWVNSFYINYTVIGEVNNYFHVVLQID